MGLGEWLEGLTLGLGEERTLLHLGCSSLGAVMQLQWSAAISPCSWLAGAQHPVPVPHSHSLQSRIYIGKRLAASSANPL